MSAVFVLVLHDLRFAEVIGVCEDLERAQAMATHHLCDIRGASDGGPDSEAAWKDPAGWEAIDEEGSLHREWTRKIREDGEVYYAICELILNYSIWEQPWTPERQARVEREARDG